MQGRGLGGRCSEMLTSLLLDNFECADLILPQRRETERETEPRFSASSKLMRDLGEVTSL